MWAGGPGASLHRWDDKALMMRTLTAGCLGDAPLRRQKSILGGKQRVRRRRVDGKFAPFPVGLETEDAGVDMASFPRRSLAHRANEF